MQYDKNQIMSEEEIRKDFVKAEKIADTQGAAVIMCGDRPKYALVNLDDNPILDLTDDEKIDIVAKRVLERYKPAFKELAKW